MGKMLSESSKGLGGGRVYCVLYVVFFCVVFHFMSPLMASFPLSFVFLASKMFLAHFSSRKKLLIDVLINGGEVRNTKNTTKNINNTNTHLLAISSFSHPHPIEVNTLCVCFFVFESFENFKRGRCWLLLVVVGCCWLLLVVVGCCLSLAGAAVLLILT